MPPRLKPRSELKLLPPLNDETGEYLYPDKSKIRQSVDAPGAWCVWDAAARLAQGAYGNVVRFGTAEIAADFLLVAKQGPASMPENWDVTRWLPAPSGPHGERFYYPDGSGIYWSGGVWLATGPDGTNFSTGEGPRLFPSAQCAAERMAASGFGPPSLPENQEDHVTPVPNFKDEQARLREDAAYERAEQKKLEEAVEPTKIKNANPVGHVFVILGQDGIKGLSRAKAMALGLLQLDIKFTATPLGDGRYEVAVHDDEHEDILIALHSAVSAL